jgi:hypothetical protein
MGYLTVAEAKLLGAAAAVTQPILDQASVIVDLYCQRPEGFKIEAHTDGTPVCMAQVSGTGSFTLGPVAAGSSVPVQLPAWVSVLPGDVIVFDRGTATAEAVIVSAASGQAATLQSARFTHASPAATLGLALVEVGRLPAKGKFPLRKANAVPLSAAADGVLAPFTFDGSSVTLASRAGGAARVSYLAGYVALPTAIKQACVNIANNVANAADEDLYFALDVAGLKTNDPASPVSFGGRVDRGTMLLLTSFVQRV